MHTELPCSGKVDYRKVEYQKVKIQKSAMLHTSLMSFFNQLQQLQKETKLCIIQHLAIKITVVAMNVKSELCWPILLRQIGQESLIYNLQSRKTNRQKQISCYSYFLNKVVKQKMANKTKKHQIAKTTFKLSEESCNPSSDSCGGSMLCHLQKP